MFITLRRKRYHAFVVAQLVLAGGCASQAQVQEVDSAQSTTRPVESPFSLTVYSTADPATFSPQEIFQQQISRGFGYGFGFGNLIITPGFGVVREIRPMHMTEGTNQVEFTDVAAGIDPTTVAFRSLTAPKTTTVLEQNFDYDLASAEQLLQKCIGKEVTMRLGTAASATPGPSTESQTSVVKGVLLSAAGNSYVLRTGKSPQELMVISAQNVASVGLTDTSSNFVAKPTLKWKVEAKQPGEHKVQVTYQTDGLTWRADYSLLIAPDEKTADLSAWVTLVNGSGMSYPQTALKLVAGNVQRFVPQSRMYLQGQAFGGGGGRGGGGFGGFAGFEEKSFFEYHMYTLGATTSLNNNSTKQIELFTPKLQTPIEKVYVYHGLPSWARELLQHQQSNLDDNFGRTGNKDVDIYVRLRNSEANHLGIPLPAGRLRTYKIDPADDSREFIGEDIIPHTPRDEPVLARLGTAFELVGERKQVSFQRTNNTFIEKFEISLRNHKNSAAGVIVREILYRGLNWQILEESDKWTKIDYRTIQFPVEVPANSEKKVSYEVRYSIER